MVEFKIVGWKGIEYMNPMTCCLTVNNFLAYDVSLAGSAFRATWDFLIYYIDGVESKMLSISNWMYVYEVQ